MIEGMPREVTRGERSFGQERCVGILKNLAITRTFASQLPLHLLEM